MSEIEWRLTWWLPPKPVRLSDGQMEAIVDGELSWSDLNRIAADRNAARYNRRTERAGASAPARPGEAVG
jgi:hypothetical protein